MPQRTRHGTGGSSLIGVVLVTVTLRVRSAVWFATGVVLTLLATLLVTQAWQADAAPGDEDSTFVPVAPCRLFDTRPDKPPNAGNKTPLGAGEANVRSQQVTGSVGNCVGIPANATAVSMNVTIVSPTAQSNLRVFPADVPTPTASNLNWLPGQSPTPNKVDVKLSPAGKIKLFNAAGTVHVLADVVGYYTKSTLQELANTRPIARSASTSNIGLLPVASGSIVLSVTIEAPVAGLIQVAASAQVDDFVGNALGGSYTCKLTQGVGSTTSTGTLGLADRTAFVGTTEGTSCSTNGALAVAKGTYVINLVLGTSASVADGYEEASLDAIFVAGGTTT